MSRIRRCLGKVRMSFRRHRVDKAGERSFEERLAYNFGTVPTNRSDSSGYCRQTTLASRVNTKRILWSAKQFLYSFYSISMLIKLVIHKPLADQFFLRLLPCTLLFSTRHVAFKAFQISSERVCAMSWPIFCSMGDEKVEIICLTPLSNTSAGQSSSHKDSLKTLHRSWNDIVTQRGLPPVTCSTAGLEN